MRVALIGPLSAAVFLLLALSACREDEGKQLDGGLVVANQAFEEHFGPAPQGEKGRAFARVGFLPVQGDPRKVQPFPLFLFTQENQLQLILERLTDAAFQLPTAPGIYRPFPNDLAWTMSPVEGGTITLRLTSAAAWPEADQAAAGMALAETALQFPEVEQVRILINDTPSPGMPTDGYRHQTERIAELGPPQLILVAGAWEGEAELAEELLIEFDRPVRVENVDFRHEDGQPVKGEYFTSIFGMAIVVHPEEPGRFQKGTRLQVAWNVVDALGRIGQGERTEALQRFEH